MSGFISSDSETLNVRQPYMVDIRNGCAGLRSVQSVREALSTFESCLRLDCGQSPTELGMSSSSSSSINFPVLDSRIKPTRIFAKCCWLPKVQITC